MSIISNNFTTVCCQRSGIARTDSDRRAVMFAVITSRGCRLHFLVCCQALNLISTSSIISHVAASLVHHTSSFPCQLPWIRCLNFFIEGLESCDFKLHSVTTWWTTAHLLSSGVVQGQTQDSSVQDIDTHDTDTDAVFVDSSRPCNGSAPCYGALKIVGFISVIALTRGSTTDSHFCPIFHVLISK